MQEWLREPTRLRHLKRREAPEPEPALPEPAAPPDASDTTAGIPLDGIAGRLCTGIESTAFRDGGGISCGAEGLMMGGTCFSKGTARDGAVVLCTGCFCLEPDAAACCGAGGASMEDIPEGGLHIHRHG